MIRFQELSAIKARIDAATKPGVGGESPPWVIVAGRYSNQMLVDLKTLVAEVEDLNDWGPERIEPAAPEKCKQIVHTVYDQASGKPPHRCRFYAVKDGYCKRHHPDAQAEVAARRQARAVRQLVQMGFAVTLEPAAPSEEEARL